MKKYTKEQQKKHRDVIKMIGKIMFIVGVVGLITIDEFLPTKELIIFLASFLLVACIGFSLYSFIESIER